MVNFIDKWIERGIKKKYLGSFVPIYLKNMRCWCVDTAHGIEIGDIAYIASEFSKSGVVYHFRASHCLSPELPDHEHSFEAVLIHVITDFENFSIEEFREEYSKQELEYLNTLKETVLRIKETGKPIE